AETALRIAHTLKGIAATIGAGDTSETAARLEEALRQKADRQALEPLLGAFARSLAGTVAALTEGLAAAQPPGAGPATPSDLALQEVCRTLAQMLVSGDMAAVRFVESHATSLAGAFPREFRPIRQAIEIYDFDRALEGLEAGCRGAGIPLPTGG
ncbi:MAG: Hpt domain-containing protein, partial [Gammaproteobacteria bacterium]